MDHQVGLFCSCNWEETEGCLDESVVLSSDDFEDFYEQKPRDSLVVLCSPGSQPCQITLNFMVNPCKVHSIYLESTANVCELYSMTDNDGDNEYVCTVHPDNALEMCDYSGDSGTSTKGEINLGKSKYWSDTSSSSSDQETKPHHSETAHGLHSSGDDDRASVTSARYKKKNSASIVQNETIQMQKCVKRSDSSDEDSWLEVNSSSSSESKKLNKIAGCSKLGDYSNKKHFEASMERENAIKFNICQSHSSNIHVEEHCNSGFLETITEDKHRCIVLGDQGGDNDTASISTSNANTQKKVLHKSKIEFVNSKPCISLTFRFPSADDRYSLAIEKICIHATSVALNSQPMAPNAYENSSPELFDNPLADSLADMLRDLFPEESVKNREKLFNSIFDGSEENDAWDAESFFSESSSTSQSSMDVPFQASTSKSTIKQAACKASGDDYLDKLFSYQNKLYNSLNSEAASPNDKAAEESEMREGVLIKLESIYKDLAYKTDDSCTADLLNHDFFEACENEIRGKENLHTNPFQEPDNSGFRYVESESREKLRNERYVERRMDILQERIENLEDMCSRMEMNVMKVLVDMETRISLLESKQRYHNRVPPTSTACETCKTKQGSLHFDPLNTQEMSSFPHSNSQSDTPSEIPLPKNDEKQESDMECKVSRENEESVTGSLPKTALNSDGDLLDQQIRNKKVLVAIEEAVARALSAFATSAATHEQETSRQKEQSDDIISDKHELLQNVDENIIFSEFRSQQSMDSIPYLGSQNYSKIEAIHRGIANLCTMPQEIQTKVDCFGPASTNVMVTPFSSSFDNNHMSSSSSSSVDVCFRRRDSFPFEQLLNEMFPIKTEGPQNFQECKEPKFSVNFSKMKRSPLLLFIEDEGLGDFVIVSPSSSVCKISS